MQNVIVGYSLQISTVKKYIITLSSNTLEVLNNSVHFTVKSQFQGSGHRNTKKTQVLGDAAKMHIMYENAVPPVHLFYKFLGP